MPSTFDSPRATFQAIGDATGNASRRSMSSMSTLSTFQLPSAGPKETSTNLDFNTNFDLSFTQQSHSTPYALREHERRFALFLEPSSKSRFYNSIEKFNDKVFRTLGPNQAQNYAPHISIIDSLVLTRGEEWENRWAAVQDLRDTVEDTIRDLAPQMQSPTFEGLGIVDKPEKALVIGLRSSDSYNELVRRLNRTMYDKHRVKVDMRPMNRLHLAYDRHHPLNDQKLAQLQEIANETIAAEDLVWQRIPFDIVLYEVMLESQVTGVRHQMAELGRWRVVDGISKHPTVTSTNFFMPASIVGTLKVMMTRWKVQSGKKRLRKEWKAIDTRLQSKLVTTM
ncbi:hypothetical protein VKS41_008560 [Umbelopsis sp. WA50703]